MDIDTPSSPPPGPYTSPTPQPTTPATPLHQQVAPPSTPDLLNSVHAPGVQHALQPKSKGAKRTSHQIGSNTPTSQPLRLRPTPQHITPATPLRQQATPPSSPDLLNAVHAESVRHDLQPKSQAANRSTHQIGCNTPTRHPLRLRPTPSQDTAKKLEEASTLLEEIYHTQGIDKQETGLALTAIDKIRRSCGYPHLESSRDPWNPAAHQ